MKAGARHGGLLLVALALAFASASAGDSFTVATCPSASQYFDTTSLSCQACSSVSTAAALIPATSTDIPLFGALDCECPAQFITVAASCDINQPSVCGPPTCTYCGATQVADSQRTTCLTCGSSTTGIVSGECGCPAQYKLSERLESGALRSSKECIQCSSSSRVITADTSQFKADLYSCQQCPGENMEFISDTECKCKSGFTQVGVDGMGPLRCVSTAKVTVIAVSHPESSAAAVQYNDVVAADGTATTATVGTSLTIKNLYMAAAVHCFNWRSAADNVYCQALANLCVLQMYNRDSKVCDLFISRIAVARDAAVHGWAGWASTLPQLYYSTTRGAGATAITNTLALKTAMSFDAATRPGTQEWMEFKLARWSVNGSFLGLADLSTQLQYCGGSGSLDSEGRPRWLKYGVTRSSSFECDLDALAGRGNEFYDLYIVDQAGLAGSVDAVTGLPTQLYPVPVRIINYRDQTAQPNINVDTAAEADDELVRRFFLYDSLSGITSVGAKPTYLRYAKTITLTITGQTGDTTLILPPVLTIEYEERSTAAFATDPTFSIAPVTFAAQYTTDVSGFWTAALVMFVLCMVLVVMACCLRTFNWCRRSSRTREEQSLDLASLLRAFVFFAGCYSTVNFYLILLLTTYWLFFFKLQDSAFTFLPAENSTLSSSDYDIFAVMVVLCWLAHLFRMVEILYTQTTMDIFFLDWEKEKPGEAGARAGARGEEEDDDALDPEAGRAVRGQRGRASRGRGSRNVEKRKRARYPQVSAWRSILAANEFTEMQTVRKTSVEGTMLALLFFLRGLGLEYVATPHPTATDLTPGATNPVLLFSLVSLMWIGLCVVQRLWAWGIYERFFAENPTARFIDLLTMAKVSCLFLTDKYHGFYLHCRSSHTYADNNMAQLVNQLLQEEEGLAIKRGLENCPDGPTVQGFEIFVAKNWRDNYDRVYGDLAVRLRENPDPLRNRQIGGCTLVRKRTPEDTKAMLKATAVLMHFLKGFIDESDPTFLRAWEERHWYYRIFGIPPDFDVGNTANQSPTLLYGDPTGRWEGVLLRGVEDDLMLYNLLTMAVALLLTSNTVISVIATYAMEKLFIWLRGSLGLRNLAKKSLVDDRFLQ